MAEENKDENGEGALDLSALGSFDFTPAWAKGKANDPSRYARFEEQEERRDERRDRGDRPRRDDRGPRPFGKPAEGRLGERGPKPSFGGPRRDDRGPRRDDRPARPSFGGPRRDERPARPFTKPLDVDVRILPGQKQLGEFIRKIQSAPYMAYPLKQLAYFFLDHPEACVLRIAPKKDAEPIAFHQCKACGFVAFSEEELMAHVLSAHLGDYYESEEIECEPPKGAFNCVARCGLSGVLLGPPNLHGYDARVREVMRTRYPNMDEASYRARIEMVRDPDVVEEWRKSATKKTIYRRKGAAAAAAPVPVPAEGAEGAEAAAPAETPAVPAIEREAAEREFRRMFASALMTAPRAVDMTAEMALKSKNLGLVFACRDAIQKEKRFPASLFFALRGAFHHRKLQFFRANDPRGPEFVTAVKPTALDTAHAIPELAELVAYVTANPDQSPAAVVTALGGGDAAKAQAVKAHIMWLLEKGHLVCYTNGGLVPPAEHPHWSPKPRKPAAAKVEAAAPEAAPAQEAPAAEAPAAPAEPAPETPAPEAPAAPAAEPAPAPEA